MIVLIGPIGLIGNHCLKERTFSDGYHKEMNTGSDYSGPRRPGGRMTITRDDYVLGEDIAHS